MSVQMVVYCWLAMWAMFAIAIAFKTRKVVYVVGGSFLCSALLVVAAVASGMFVDAVRAT